MQYIELERARFEAKRYFKNLDNIQEDLDSLFCMMPAADVAPVRHGRWDKQEHYLHGHYITTTCICSVCGSCPTMEYRYCPYCGAKMDGGEGNA